MSQTTPTPTEDSQLMIWKHECLVRWLIKYRMKNREAAYLWLKGDGIKKGFMQMHPGSTLEQDVKGQWAKGNRGKEGDWR